MWKPYLGIVATGLLFAAGMVNAARADGVLRCAPGFDKVAETDTAIICRRSESVTSRLMAERLSRRWVREAGCSGDLQGPQSSIADSGAGVWLVTVRYDCNGGF